MRSSAYADLIIAGRIATLAGDSGFGWQPAIAIADERVIAVGQPSELEPLATTRTERWRLGEDLAVMPSITDAHLHLMTLILAQSQIDLTGLDRGGALDAIAAANRERLALGDETGWLLGHGWSLHDLGGWPDADDLERAAPGRPIALYSHDHHTRWISDAAMRLAVLGVRGASSGDLVRKDERGRPTGILHEGAASLVDSAIPEPGRQELEDGLAVVAAQLAALGVTGCHDPGELDDDRVMRRGPLFYRDLVQRDLLPLRVHSSIRAPQLERAIEIGLRSGESVGRYTTGWLKLFADGSLGSRSAALLEPYTDAATNPPTGGPTGMVVTDAEELRELLERAAGGGIVGEVHAIGDGAVRMALDVLERVRVPGARLMPRIEHAQLVDRADQPRFGRLGIAASVQPVHLRSDASQARVAWGSRVSNAFPLRGLLDGGALIPFGTDAPVEPSDPWPGIAVAVARRDPLDPAVEPLGPEHAITLERAIRAACLDPAIVAGIEDLGRLTAGNRADLIVVPAAGFREPFDAAALAATRPVATLLDGKVIHQSSNFDRVAR